MYVFYFIALVPSIIGGILFICNRRVVWQEWIGGTIIALILSAIMHGVAIYKMVSDQESWSGKITHVCHFPKWTEEYTEIHTETETDSEGNVTTRTYTDTHHDTHPEHWVAYLDFGTIQEERRIDYKLFCEIKHNFGNLVENGGKQSCNYLSGDFDGGDNNIYRTSNKTGYIYPVTTLKYFENKVKAAPTLFSFAKVPTNAPVYEWPENPNWMASDRLLGVSKITPREWDLMNTRLGAKKKVNVIMIGFNSADSMLGQWQEAKWVGGKKNDVVLCYGFNRTNIIWSYVYGWTEKTICKRNLETILLNNPINDSIIPIIEKEIIMNYEIKEWRKFDYITIEPPRWAYITLILVMLFTQTGFWWWANMNEFEKQ